MVKKYAGTAVALIVVGLTIWGLSSFIPVKDNISKTNEADEHQPAEESFIRLSDNKLSTAGIRSQPAQVQTLQQFRSLTARFAYDDTRHVAVRAATDGLLESVAVKPGDTVTTGQVIAVLRSPDVASARSTVLNCQAEMKLAKKQNEWQSNICKGVEQLATAIRAGEQLESIEKRLNDETLGD